MKPKITCSKCGKQFTTAGMASHEVVHEHLHHVDVYRSYTGNVVIALRKTLVGHFRRTTEYLKQETIGL